MTLAKLVPITSSYSHLNTKTRIEAACKEHTNFNVSDFAGNTTLFVVKVSDIVFDYAGMAHQPRLGSLDQKIVNKYKAQATEGVNGIYGIRKPITVYWSTSRQKFVGIKGHHRFAASTDIGYDYIVVEIDDSFPQLTNAQQIDLLMSDNAFPDNGLQSCQGSVNEALKATLQDDSFMQKERTEQQLLQNKKKNVNEPARKKQIDIQINDLNDKIRAPLEALAQKWNPSATRKSNKSLVTKALNNHNAKHLIQVFNHSTKDRKDFISSDVNTLGSDDLHFDWGQAVTNNNVQIQLPTAEFLGRIREYKKANKGKLPSSFTFYTCIPGGVKDYDHLFNLRSRIKDDILDRIADVYPTVPRRFKFLGQVLNKRSPWVENHKQLYSSSYVENYLKQKAQTE